MINHKGAFTNLVARWPGSVHDSRILKECPLQEVLDRNMLGAYYILGDSGYACQTNLLTPYPFDFDDEKKAYYNECLSKRRCKVECVIGQWKRKFPCLSKTIQYQPEKVCTIIKACAYLWNLGIAARDNKGFDPDDYVIPEKDSFDRLMEATPGGVHRREEVKKYLWKHRRN